MRVASSVDISVAIGFVLAAKNRVNCADRRAQFHFSSMKNCNEWKGEKLLHINNKVDAIVCADFIFSFLLIETGNTNQTQKQSYRWSIVKSVVISEPATGGMYATLISLTHTFSR